MNKAKLPQPIESNWFCPDCANPLGEIPCEDPFTICVACKFDHRLFVTPKGIPSTMQQFKARGRAFLKLKMPKLGDESIESVASFWLSEPQFRESLNPQLAEVLRAILDKIRHRRKVPKRVEFNWCPTCGLKLSEFKQSDIWLHGLKCAREHTFYLRINSLYKGADLIFDAEFDDSILQGLIKSWSRSYFSQFISGKKGLYIHSSIRRILKEFQKNGA
jgi:hypothetical protein